MNDTNIRISVFAGMVLLQAGCGGSGSSPSPTPGPGGTPSAPTVTIAIVGRSGAQAYNPATPSLSPNQTFGFRNNDSAVHRIVADNGTFDSGTLNPGAASASITVSSAAAIPFHCTLHPSMVGSINGSTPPSGGGGTTPPEY